MLHVITRLKAPVLLLLMLATAKLCRSQDSVLIRGIVVSVHDRKPVAAASVTVQGTKRGTMTDSLGLFRLTLRRTDSLLVFSSKGYLTRREPVQGRTYFTISLENDINSLEDVVVIAYGTSRKKDLTGAVGEVNIADLKKAPVPSFDQALAGRVAGVRVTSADGQPGGEMDIIIRGGNSITQSNAPLYVVDGFPIEESLNNIINPADIESIQILKDASATAIYGARGANGVVVITTKSAAAGAPVVRYDNLFTIMENVQRQKLMSPYEFVKYQVELRPSLEAVYFANGKTLESYRDVEGIDWQDHVFKRALMQNHNVSVSGGTGKTKYVISGSVLNQEGIIINSGFRRYQGRLKLDQEVSKKIRVGVNANYSASKTYGTVAAEIGSENIHHSSALMYSIWGYRPITGNSLLDSSLLEEEVDPDVSGVDNRFNPVMTISNTYNPKYNNLLFVRGYINYDIIPNLSLNLSGGYTNSSSRTEIFNNSKTRSGSPYSTLGLGVNGSVNNSSNNYYLSENTLTYTKRLGKVHHLKALAGVTYQKNTFQTSGFAAVQVPNESLGISGLDEGILNSSDSRYSENVLISYLGRVDYRYKDKYLATLSYREDGSSKFSDRNRWASFYAGSVAWRFSSEKFMSRVSFVTDAKLRAGYGITGNNRVPDFASYSSLQLLSNSGYSFGNNPGQGLIPDAIGSKSLKWETTGQWDIGLDLSLFNNRVSFTTDYYYKKTKDLLLLAEIPLSSGYGAGYKNIGVVSNEGIEFSLNTVNINRNKFLWTTSFNIAFNKTKVHQLNSGQNQLFTDIAWGPYYRDAPYVAVIGKPVALFYGYIFDGIYQYSDFDQLPNGTYVLKENIPNNGDLRSNIKPGFIKYRDINGDGVVDSHDQTIIGNPNPVHIGGISNNFSYGSLDLNIFFQWSYGNQVLNANKLVFEGHRAVVTTNQFASFEDRWTPENQTNEMYSAKGQGPLVYSDRVLSDGSFIRLKTVSLGYNLPKNLLRKAGIKSLRIFISGQNLYTWHKYNGLDPEVSVRNSALTPGFDYSAYPRARTFAAGLNLTL